MGGGGGGRGGFLLNSFYTKLGVPPQINWKFFAISLDVYHLDTSSFILSFVTLYYMYYLYDRKFQCIFCICQIKWTEPNWTDPFVERVAKNNSWNNGDRHKIREIFPISCFVFVITPVWETVLSSAMTQIKAHLMEKTLHLIVRR